MSERLPVDPASKSRDSAPAGWARRTSRACGSVWNRMLGMEMLWAGLFVLVGVWVLLPPRTFFAARVEAGEIATRTFVAPRDLLEEDEAQTRAEQEAARRAVLPVYDFEPAIARDLDNQLMQLFEVGRSSGLDALGVSEIEPEGDAEPDSERSPLSEFLAASQLKVAPEPLDALQRAEFSAALEDRLRSISMQLLRAGLVGDKDRLLENRERGITVRDLATGVERIELDLYRSVGFPEEAQELIATESQRWTDLSRDDRLLLGTFVLDNLFPNLEINRSETRTRSDAAAAAAVGFVRQIRAGEVIVRKGDPIAPIQALFINGSQGQRRFTDVAVPTLGKVLLLSLAALVLWLILARESRLVDSRERVLSGLCLLLIVSLLMTRFGFLAAAALGGFFERAPFNQQDAYYFAIPFASVAFLTFLLYGRGLALAVGLVFSLVAGQFVVDGSLNLLIVALSGSLAAIYLQDQVKRRSGVTFTGLAIGIVNAVAALMVLALTGDRLLDLQSSALNLASAFAGGVLVAAVVSFALPVFEWALGLTTDVTLVELSNTNLPLLRRLAFEAPGTFQHSLMVANLAKGGCAEIGANAVLAYTGGLYHDIGKLNRPEYFIENQRGGNPHDDLSPSLSALIVVNHVTEGVELALENRLPRSIRDAIEQHHGTHLLKFFYNRAQEREDGDRVVEESYRYSGPKPQSRVMGVLMLADAVEAASRTLTEPSEATIHNLVSKIFDSYLEDEQLDETGLTLGDIRVVGAEFERILSTLHHRRVDYPGFDFESGSAETHLQVVGRN